MPLKVHDVVDVLDFVALLKGYFQLHTCNCNVLNLAQPLQQWTVRLALANYGMDAVFWWDKVSGDVSKKLAKLSISAGVGGRFNETMSGLPQGMSFTSMQ